MKKSNVCKETGKVNYGIREKLGKKWKSAGKRRSRLFVQHKGFEKLDGCKLTSNLGYYVFLRK